MKKVMNLFVSKEEFEAYGVEGQRQIKDNILERFENDIWYEELIRIPQRTEGVNGFVYKPLHEIPNLMRSYENAYCNEYGNELLRNYIIGEKTPIMRTPTMHMLRHDELDRDFDILAFGNAQSAVVVRDVAHKYFDDIMTYTKRIETTITFDINLDKLVFVDTTSET